MEQGKKISAFIEKYLGIKISSSTIYRVLKRNKLIERTRKLVWDFKKRKQRGKKNCTRRELKANKPGTVLIDVKYLYWCGRTFYQFTAIDKFTRIGFARKVQADNGSKFLGEFEEYLREKGIEHYFSYPKSPKTNAHVERFIQITESELWTIEGTEPTADE